MFIISWLPTDNKAVTVCKQGSKWTGQTVLNVTQMLYLLRSAFIDMSLRGEQIQ